MNFLLLDLNLLLFEGNVVLKSVRDAVLKRPQPASCAESPTVSRPKIINEYILFIALFLVCEYLITTDFLILAQSALHLYLDPVAQPCGDRLAFILSVTLGKIDERGILLK